MSAERKISDHRGVLRVAPHLLAEALHLPAGTQITGAAWDFDTEQLRLFVSHIELPQTIAGCPVMPVGVVITRAREKNGLEYYESRWTA